MTGNEAGQELGIMYFPNFCSRAGRLSNTEFFSSVFVTMMSNLPLVFHLVLSSF